MELPETTIVLRAVDGGTAVGICTHITTTVYSERGVPVGGMVQFKDGGKYLGKAQVDEAGVAAIGYTGLQGGTHMLQAEFLGMPGFKEAKSDLVNHFCKAKRKRPKADEVDLRTPTNNPSPKITFQVDMTLPGLYSSVPPVDRTTLEYQTTQMTIMIPGVGTVKHGQQFTVAGEEALRIKKVYEQYLRVIETKP